LKPPLARRCRMGARRRSRKSRKPRERSRGIPQIKRKRSAPNVSELAQKPPAQRKARPLLTGRYALHPWERCVGAGRADFTSHGTSAAAGGFKPPTKNAPPIHPRSGRSRFRRRCRSAGDNGPFLNSVGLPLCDCLPSRNDFTGFLSFTPGSSPSWALDGREAR
jgi:hypothetical protein